MGTIDTASVLEQSTVDKVATILVNDIQEAKTELELRDELKVRQIDVTAHTYLQVNVERLKAQRIMLACSKIHRRADTSNEIGTEVIVARCGKLQVNRERDIGTLEHLRAVGTTPLLMIDSMLLSEMYSRRKAQGKMIVQAEITKHTYREPRAVVIYLGIPLFARLRVNVAIVLQLEILQMKAKEETIV